MKTIDKHNPKSASKKQANTPMLPLGISDFHELVTHRNKNGDAYLFVDKSLFIRDFLNIGDEVGLIARPRRYGKTLVLSMLHHFLAAEVNGKSTKGLFDGLEISQYPNVMKYQGQHPVMFLTLEGVRGSSLEEMIEQTKEVISGLFQTHHYLLTEGNLTPEDSRRFKKILNKTATKIDYQASLHFLSRLLYQHTGKYVYILLDSYDRPKEDACLHGFFDKWWYFLVSILGYAFKGNSSLAKGFITGLSITPKTSLFSGFNNVQEYTEVDDTYYPSYFGFTETETNNLLDRAKLPQKAHEIKEKYSIREHTLYNPFAVLSFIRKSLLLDEARMGSGLKPDAVNTADPT